MNTGVKGLLEAYIEWLRSEIGEEELDGGWTSFTFPYLDRHNDYLQVYLREESDGVRITDEGQIIRDLVRIGCDLKSPGTRRRRIAREILKGMGLDVDLSDSVEIAAKASNGDLPEKLHSVLMSMLAIDGLANASPPNVVAMFRDDIQEWLEELRLPFEKNAHFVGRSGDEHEFDFVIPATKNRPGSILQAVGKADKAHIHGLVYEVTDTRSEILTRQGAAPKFYALFGGSGEPSMKLKNSLYRNDIDPYVWTDRDNLRLRIA